MDFNQFNIQGIDINNFKYNVSNNSLFIKASFLGNMDLSDEDFMLDGTFIFKNNHLTFSQYNFNYGTFVINKDNSQLFYTFSRRIKNEFSDRLLYKYIGQKGNIDNYATQLIVLLD